LEKKSNPESGPPDRATRVHDPVGGEPEADRIVREYDEHFRDSDVYIHHLRRWIAGYSRGDDLRELRRLYLVVVVEKVERADRALRARWGDTDRLFWHKGHLGERYRDALVLLSVGLCLRAPGEAIETILACCERGDPLIETVAGAAAPGSEKPHGPPAFPAIFDGLYEALGASGAERERCVQEYLSAWYPEKMKDFSFKDVHLQKDTADYVGYWCFEAAGVVAALGIDDRSFAEHPHYPRDLVAFYRSEGG
jgi:hypothetical protein